jgi:hypothetical protein
MTCLVVQRLLHLCSWLRHHSVECASWLTPDVLALFVCISCLLRKASCRPLLDLLAMHHLSRAPQWRHVQRCLLCRLIPYRCASKGMHAECWGALHQNWEHLTERHESCNGASALTANQLLINSLHPTAAHCTAPRALNTAHQCLVHAVALHRCWVAVYMMAVLEVCMPCNGN